MKKLFTLIALALSAQASMAQTTVASFTFPDEHLTPEGSKKAGSATDVPGTNCTVDYSSVGGWKNSDTPEANSVQMNGKFYQKLGSDNTKITFKLTSGSFQAGDKFTATMSRADKTGTDGFYFKERTTGNYKTISYVANSEVTLEYTLVAGDINDDGSLTIARYSSNCYARHFEITRSSGGGDTPTPDVDKALLKEYFDYTENSALEGQGGWVVSTKASEATGSSPIVISRTITYSGYDGSATGKAALFDDDQQQTTEGNSRNSVVPFVSAKPATDDVFYAAFLGDFSNTATTSGKEIFSFIKQGAAAGDGTTARGRVWVKVTSEGNKCFAIRKNGQTIETYSAETPKTDAALLVVKYVNKSTGSSGANDEFYLFVNPDPTKTEAENAAVKMDALGNDADGGADLRYVCFRQTKLNAAYAGLRVAKTWEDAVMYNSGGATAISRVEARQKAANGEFFNLSGQRVAQPTKGLYIINGKKVVVK